MRAIRRRFTIVFKSVDLSPAHNVIDTQPEELPDSLEELMTMREFISNQIMLIDAGMTLFGIVKVTLHTQMQRVSMNLRQDHDTQ